MAQEESLKGPAVVGGWMPNGCESGWQRAAPDTPQGRKTAANLISFLIVFSPERALQGMLQTAGGKGRG